tara:strand:+ start:1443 stop:1781 length:339 start_codon:yes stop_codon:yes gene_type:complete
MRTKGLYERFKERQRRKNPQYDDELEKLEKENLLLGSKEYRNTMKPGNVYYSLCPDDPKKFRTIRLHFNPYTQSLRPQVSNPVEGVPPPELEEMSPLLLQRLMKVPQSNIYY